MRVVIKKKVFDKGDEIRYSNEVYEIMDIKKNKYLLDDDKYYKEYEIKKSNQINIIQPYPVKKIRDKNEEGIDKTNIVRNTRSSSRKL